MGGEAHYSACRWYHSHPLASSGSSQGSIISERVTIGAACSNAGPLLASPQGQPPSLPRISHASAWILKGWGRGGGIEGVDFHYCIVRRAPPIQSLSFSSSKNNFVLLAQKLREQIGASAETHVVKTQLRRPAARSSGSVSRFRSQLLFSPISAQSCWISSWEAVVLDALQADLDLHDQTPPPNAWR